MVTTNPRTPPAGFFVFHRRSPAVPGDNSGSSGNSFASFLLGQVYSGGFTIPNTEMLRMTYHAFFAQDDWKVTPKLTVNAGIRYELYMCNSEDHHSTCFFDPSLPDPPASTQPA